MTDAEYVAQLFHETYERLAPDFGYKTREASAKPWAEVPAKNKALMIAVAGEVLQRLSPVGVVHHGQKRFKRPSRPGMV